MPNELDVMDSPSGASVTQTDGADLSAPTRIKRNTACVRCRDAKVKCNASLNPGQPCLRCSKLDLECVVDKGHKRTSRRSKLEELAAELVSLKQSVVASNTSSGVSPAAVPPLRPGQLPSPHARDASYINTRGLMPAYTGPPRSTTSFGGEPMSLDQQSESPVLSSQATRSRPADQVAEPRALGSSVFSGEDIEYYFDQYFDHFHPFMPIVCIRNPDACYKAAPVLFWTIIVTACRRYAKRGSTFGFLVASISSEVSSAIAAAPIRPPAITALLILSTWSLPTIRFMNDPTYVYAGIALNSSLYLGLHTGNGNYLELTAKYDTSTTDEAATYIWAASNIISQRTSSYLGYPPTALFSGKALRGILDGDSPYIMPRSFAINLAAAKFSNRLMKSITAGVDDGPGISYHLVQQIEEDFVTLQRSLHDGTPDIDDFMLRSTLLEVQVLHWLPTTGRNTEVLRRDLLRTYNTSESLIKLALDLERKSGFLYHAPHYVFRSVLLAACTIISYLRSPYPSPSSVLVAGADMVAQNVISALKACSVQADDLPLRAANVMQGYWSIKDRLPVWDMLQLGGADKFKHRLGASIVFDCLARWKRDLEWTRATAGEGTQAKNTPGPSKPHNGDATLTPGQNPDAGLSDPVFQGIDWSSFMDDFEWDFPPSLADLERQVGR